MLRSTDQTLAAARRSSASGDRNEAMAASAIIERRDARSDPRGRPNDARGSDRDRSITLLPPGRWRDVGLLRHDYNSIPSPGSRAIRRAINRMSRASARLATTSRSDSSASDRTRWWRSPSVFSAISCAARAQVRGGDRHLQDRPLAAAPFGTVAASGVTMLLLVGTATGFNADQSLRFGAKPALDLWNRQQPIA